jgi:hypothetical protein
VGFSGIPEKSALDGTGKPKEPKKEQKRTPAFGWISKLGWREIDE